MHKYQRAGLAPLIAFLFVLSAVGLSTQGTLAAGNQNCGANDGCVYQNTGQTGQYRGFNVNASNYGSLTYADTSSLANNVRSWKFLSNPAYISFCLYNFASYIGSLNSGNNVGGSGNVTQGSESSRFLIQPAC